MKKALFVIIALLLIPSCRPKAPVPVETLERVYVAPVKPAGDVLPDAGQKTEDIVAVVTIPATTPTGTPTIVTIYEKPAGVRRTIFRTRTEARHPVDVISNNPTVTVEYPQVTPWWWWFLAALAIAGAAYFIVRKYFEIFWSPFSKVLSFWKRIRGLWR